jgi:hypothetical protein
MCNAFLPIGEYAMLYARQKTRFDFRTYLKFFTNEETDLKDVA